MLNSWISFSLKKEECGDKSRNATSGKVVEKRSKDEGEADLVYLHTAK